MNKKIYLECKRQVYRGEVKCRGHGRYHWFFDVKSNSTLGLWHVLAFDLKKEFPDNFTCSCPWACTYGLIAETGKLSKPCRHMITALIFLKERYNIYDKLLEDIETVLGVNDENIT